MKLKTRKAYVCSLAFILSFAVLALGGGLATATYDGGGEGTILTAELVSEPITIDGTASEPAWSRARPIRIPVVDGKVGDVDVEMRALYDFDYVYFFIEWPDPTKSDTILWNYSDGRWLPPSKTTEDMFTIFWNIEESVRGYNIAGCSITCHADRMRTNRPGELIDYWKWKAEKGNPTGYMWDGYLDDTLVEEDEYIVTPSGRKVLKTWHAHKMDETTPDYVEEQQNAVLDESGRYMGPRYYSTGEDPTHLSSQDIGKRAVEVRYINGTPESFSAPAGVPFYISERPLGSAGDIDARGTYSDEKWHLEIMRKLVTGHPDDVQFDTTKLYWFSIAVNDDSHGAANAGRGQGHSISLLAKTLEFGGSGSYAVGHMGLVRDYLTTARVYTARGDGGLAASEIGYALVLFEDIEDETSSADPELYIHIKDHFTLAKRVPSQENIDALIRDADLLILTLQGKRIPPKPSLFQTLLVLWGRVQLYVFIFLAALVLYPIYRTIQTGRKPVFRKMSIFLFLVMTPVFLEGLGRLGAALGIPFLYRFSFMTSEYATLLWAWLMFVALLVARAGFGEMDRNIATLEGRKTWLENKVRERTEELEETKTFLESIFNGIGEGVIVLDRDYKIISANKEYLRMVNRSEEEVLGKYCYQISHLRDTRCSGDEHHCPVLETFENAVPSRAIHTHYDKAGGEVYVEVSSYPIMDSKGKVKYVIESIINITEKKRLEEETLWAKDEIIRQMKYHEEYVFDVADRLRNPLQVFSGLLEDFDTSNFTDEQKREFHEIQKASGLVGENIKKLTKRDYRE
jgi:PAS domain S-box-containing protein